MPFKTANVEISLLENLTFLWTWILRWVSRSFATHASLCNALSSYKLCPKTVKILAVKGLINNVWLWRSFRFVVNRVFAYTECYTECYSCWSLDIITRVNYWRHLNTFWFIDPVTDIIGRFLSWLGSRIFTFGNVSRDTSLIIGQSSFVPIC